MNEQQSKLNRDQKIEEEVKELFDEQELFDEKGKPLPLQEQIDIRKSLKPKPNLDYYDNRRDKDLKTGEEIPYEGRFGKFKNDDEESKT